ncbi:MAG: septal ring lytic transglycosylase RlpA family protein, partial [Coleofasciculaceae cyanobacterium SM2_1_6]|nr:septal ring lytic transglycosylase RlpA family protein [Coleofasciculaceae cyanobacterium SM2_1_6]
LQPTFSGNAPTNQARSPQPAHQFVNQLVNKFSPQLTTQKLTTQIRLVPNFSTPAQATYTPVVATDTFQSVAQGSTPSAAPNLSIAPSSSSTANSLSISTAPGSPLPTRQPEAKFAAWWLKTGEENFCLAETNALKYSWTNLPIATQGTTKGATPAIENLSLSRKVFQILHGLLRWQDNFVQQPEPTPREVVVARSDTLLPSQQVRRNFWLLSQGNQGNADVNTFDNGVSDAQPSPGGGLAPANTKFATPPVTPKFQVWLKRHLIAEFDRKLDADLMAQRLQQMVNTPRLDPQKLQPGLVNGSPAVKLGDRLLFLVDDALKSSIPTNEELIAIKLTNSIRLALEVPALDIAQAQAIMYQLQETNTSLTGLASWYGDYFHGRQTANGEIYDQHALTVAHPSLPFNTYLRITNHKNNKSVIVRVNDRGPYIPPRILDLSTIAARCVDSEDTGVVMVDAVIMEPLAKGK